MLVGQKGAYTAHWYRETQKYIIRRNGQYFLTAYSWDVVKNYVDRIVPIAKCTDSVS